MVNEAEVKKPTKSAYNRLPYFVNDVGYTATLSLLRAGAGQESHAEILLPALKKALRSNDRYVRAYAFETLSHLRTDEAIQLLIQSMQSARWCPDTHKASAF